MAIAKSTGKLSLINFFCGYESNNFVLCNFNLFVTKGEMVAVLGKNGSGKSTILKAIVSNNINKKGAILIDNQEFVAMNPRHALLQKVAYMPQRRSVFHDLTVAENLEVSSSIIPARLRKQSIHYVSQELQLSSRFKKNTRVGLLSGGQKQILGLALTLVTNPTLVLLDEPFAGLDSIAVKEVCSVLASRVKDRGMTALIAEQREAITTAVCHRTIKIG